MKKLAICLALGLASAPTAGSAQVMIDMDRITCGDWTTMPPAQEDMVSAWMSGYYNQKLGYTWIDLASFHRNVESFHKYCVEKPKDKLMEVIQTAVNEMAKKKQQ